MSPLRALPDGVRLERRGLAYDVLLEGEPIGQVWNAASGWRFRESGERAPSMSEPLATRDNAIHALLETVE